MYRAELCVEGVHLIDQRRVQVVEFVLLNLPALSNAVKIPAELLVVRILHVVQGVFDVFPALLRHARDFVNVRQILPRNFIGGVPFNVVKCLIGDGGIQNAALPVVVDGFADCVFECEPNRFFHVPLPRRRDFAGLQILKHEIGSFRRRNKMRNNLVEVVIVLGHAVGGVIVEPVQLKIDFVRRVFEFWNQIVKV